MRMGIGGPGVVVIANYHHLSLVRDVSWSSHHMLPPCVLRSSGRLGTVAWNMKTIAHCPKLFWVYPKLNPPRVPQDYIYDIFLKYNPSKKDFARGTIKLFHTFTPPSQKFVQGPPASTCPIITIMMFLVPEQSDVSSNLGMYFVVAFDRSNS